MPPPKPASLAEAREWAAKALQRGDRARAGQLLVRGADRERDPMPDKRPTAAGIEACKEAAVLLEGHEDMYSVAHSFEAWDMIGTDYEYKEELAEAATAYQAAASFCIELGAQDEAAILLGGAMRCLYRLNRCDQVLSLRRRALREFAGYLALSAPAAPAYRDADLSTLQELYRQARRVDRSTLVLDVYMDYVGRHCAMALYYIMLAAVEFEKWDMVKKNGDVVVWFAMDQHATERDDVPRLVGYSLAMIGLANRKLAEAGKSVTATPTPSFDNVPLDLRQQAADDAERLLQEERDSRLGL